MLIIAYNVLWSDVSFESIISFNFTIIVALL